MPPKTKSRRKKFTTMYASRVVKKPVTAKAKPRSSATPAAYALPGRRYPIHDKAHARNALARVAQHGTAREQALVRMAVKRRFPTIK